MVVDAASFASLFVYRLVNAYLCPTFFQPDEYCQSLEVSHRLVFGYGHSTWEWLSENALPLPIVPFIYSPAFYGAKWIDPAGKTTLHIYTPKLIQALTVAIIDLYTLKLGKRLLGPRRARVVLLCSQISLSNAYVSVRTFNSIETALTAIALASWPWLRGSGSHRHTSLEPYRDQSNVFCSDPASYLLTRFPSRVDTSFPAPQPLTDEGDWRHDWPTHLVIFEALLRDEDVRATLEERGYEEKKRI